MEVSVPKLDRSVEGLSLLFVFIHLPSPGEN
ncbi:hypothetical protein LCGC14_1928260, partial [marine sediment metagenome]